MAYATLGQASFRLRSRSTFKRFQPTASGPSAPDAPIDWKALAMKMRATGRPMPRAVHRVLKKVDRGQALSAYEEEYLQGFFKKIFKPIAKVVKAVVKPVLQLAKTALPVAAGIFLGPAAGAAVASFQTAMKQAKTKQQAVAEIQSAPSWTTLTLAEQQAILNSMTAGAPPPNIQVPGDVAAAYQRAVQGAMQSVPIIQNVPGTPTYGPPTGAPPMPWEVRPEGPPVAAAGMDVTTLALIGGGLVVGMMVLGGGRR